MSSVSQGEILTIEVSNSIGIKDILIAWRNFRKTNNECKKKYGQLDSPRMSTSNCLFLALYRQFVQYINDDSRVIYIFDSAKIASGIVMCKTDNDPAYISRAKISSQFSDIILSTQCNPSNHILLIVSMCTL